MKAILAAAAAVALALPSAQAGPVTFTATLSGAAEAPPNASAGTGTATVTFDDVLDTMRVEVSFSGLSGLVTASHIHCCTSTSGTGTAGVATVTPTFTGFPGNVTAGTYDHLFDMTQVGGFNPAFVTAHGGTFSQAFDDLLAGALDGKAYLNIHTTVVPGGEIRGFLQPVPEPSTYALLALGLAAAGTAARRRRG